MKNWNNTYRKRAMRDAEQRKQLESRPLTPENLRKIRRIEQRLSGV